MQPYVLRRFAHHAKVKERQPPVRRGQQVTRVRVGVEVPELQQLAQRALDARVH